MDHRRALNAAFYEYRDAELSVRLPRYLKPKKGIRYFGRPGKEQRLPGITGAAIQLTDAAGARVIEDSMRGAARTVSQPDVQYRVIRLGRIKDKENSLELLASTHVGPTGDGVHQYDAVYSLANRYITIAVVGRGDIAEFDELCRSVAASVKMDA